MDQQRKLHALVARLGHPRQTKGDECIFVCPGKKGEPCPSADQDKTKLSVNLRTDQFNCWVCGLRGRNLAFLMVPGSIECREYLEQRTPGVKLEHEAEERPACSSLPAEYIPLDLGAPHLSTPYLHYVRSRKLTDEQLGLYRVGYADTGKYAGRVIIPSFDANGCVNFWSARTIYDNVTPPYMLPFASKNIVSNEYLVDWSQPIYLVEGIFDEMAIGPQAIALYGKSMLSELALKMVERQPPMVYICLDRDAQRASRSLLQRLLAYDLNCAIVPLAGKDPGVMGGDAVMKICNSLQPSTGSLRSRLSELGAFERNSLGVPQ